MCVGRDTPPSVTAVAHTRDAHVAHAHRTRQGMAKRQAVSKYGHTTQGLDTHRTDGMSLRQGHIAPLCQCGSPLQGATHSCVWSMGCGRLTSDRRQTRGEQWET